MIQKRTFIHSLLFFVLLLWALPSQARIFIDVTQTSSKSFPFAFVDPVRDKGDVDPDNLGKKFADLVRKDLELMGFFRFIDEKAYLEDPKKLAFQTKDIQFASWAVLDALALSKGWYKRNKDRVVIEVHLFDVLLKQELVAKRYEGEIERIPWMAHRYANEIMRILTGENGIFDTRIAFVRKNGKYKELFVMDFNGDNLEQLTKDRSIVLSPTWANDGKILYYTGFQNLNVPQLFRHSFSKGKNSRVSKFQGMVIGLEADPSGSLLATTLTRDGNSEIYLLTSSGRVHKRLTRNVNIDVSPSFSPDGKQIVFVSDRAGSPQIYIMDRSGRNVRRLTFKGRNNTAPAWSPRGDKIAFAGMDTDGQFDIFSVNKDGSGMVRLTYDSRNNEDPTWSPDGQLIAFSSNRNGKQYQIFSMRPDGSHQTQLTRGPGNHHMPSWSPKQK